MTCLYHCNYQGSIPKGYASFTTSSGNAAMGMKQNKKGEEEKSLVTKGDKINNAKILRTLAKYLWMKDNMEFKLRVLTAMGFLVGAKVSKSKSNFSACSVLCMYVYKGQFYLELLKGFLFL